MRAIWESLLRRFRGPRACRFLERMGIDSRRYWLLMDLLDLLSERGEMMDQLGRDGVALKTSAWLYAFMSALFTIGLLVAQVQPRVYLTSFVALTAFVLCAVLMSETGNSLVNPVEGLVLAHQPIDGATYTAAKLSHLLRIVLYLVFGLNALPAVAGLFLPHTVWWYPALHFLATFATGLVAASCCCALFGWLMRFVPAKRLKAAGQIAATLPFMASFTMQPIMRALRKLAILQLLPRQPEARWSIVVSAGVILIAVVVLGLRSLSADYLIRVSLMMHASPKVVARKLRRSRMGDVVARFFGGAPARAGFAFTRTMMLRDYQFRRQLLPMAIMLPVAFGPALAVNWRIDPFRGQFTSMHLVPHAAGVALCLICVVLAYGNDYKGIWVFLLAPDRSLARFARGVYALLWIGIIVIPHLLLLPILAWAWGPLHAALFIAYSVPLATVYLALDLRLVDGMPFSKQIDPARGAMMLPLLVGGGCGVGVAVGLQWLLFHSTIAVVVAIPILAAAAYFLTRSALQVFATTIRYNLGIATTESTGLYQEVNA